MADTVTTGHYLTLYSPCDNKKISVIPLPILIPNGKIITSTHTALLSKPDLTIEEQKAHIFPGLNKALLSIGNFCNHRYQVVFNDKEVLILKKMNGKMMIKGRQDPLSNLYMLNLTQRGNLMTEFRTPSEFFSKNVYQCKSKDTLVDYHHATCRRSTQSWWVKENLKTSLIGRAYHLTWC